MDEFLSEKEQLEQIREWWREYGWYLIGGVALGGVMLLGWTQYQGYQERRVAVASALYDEMAGAALDRAAVRASELLAELRAEYPSSPYTDQAALLMASLRLDQQEPDLAIDELRFVLEETADPELSLVARLRLARLLLHLERYEETLAVLDEGDPGRFAGRFSELRGDVYVAQGDAERARTAYLEAFNAQHTDVLDRNLLQMKIDDLPVAAVVAPGPVSLPAEEEGA